MPQPMPECKEHCKNCSHADIWTAPRYHEEEPEEVTGWCEYMGEDIDDPENETCFNWGLKDEG